MADLRIVSDPDICGGDLRLEGTRLTVRFFASIRRYWAVSQVLVQYPHLTVEQVEFVWDWLDEHPADAAPLALEQVCNGLGDALYLAAADYRDAGGTDVEAFVERVALKARADALAAFGEGEKD